MKYLITEKEWEKLGKKELINNIIGLSNYIFSNYKINEVELDGCYEFDVDSVRQKGIFKYYEDENDNELVLFENIDQFSKEQLSQIYWNLRGTFLNEIE